MDPQAQWRDRDLLAEFTRVVRACPDRRFVHRLHAVVLVSAGRSCLEVAAWFGDDRRTIERWVRRWATDGVMALHDIPHVGRPARLTPQASMQLAKDLSGTPRACGHDQPQWSGKLLARHLSRDHGVNLSARQCQRLLKATAIKPMAVPGAAAGSQ